MGKNGEKQLRILQGIYLATFFAAVVFVVLTPSARQVNASENFSVRLIFLAQLRKFFGIPLCFACGAGILVSVFGKTGTQSKRIRRICFGCGLLMVGVGIYHCCGFVAFRSNPPLTFAMGMYLMENSWMISAWWSIAMVLLTYSALSCAVKS